MRAGHDCLPAGKPFGGSGLVEGGCLGVQLHVTRVDAGSEDPWIVEVALAGFDEKHGEVMVQIGQSDIVRTVVKSRTGASRPRGLLPPSNNTARTSTATHDDIKLLWEAHGYCSSQDWPIAGTARLRYALTSVPVISVKA